MLTSQQRGDRIASLFLGAAHERRQMLANLIRQELDEASAEAVELVRQLRTYVVIQAVIMPGSDHETLARATREFLAAHGVK